MKLVCHATCAPDDTQDYPTDDTLDYPTGESWSIVAMNALEELLPRCCRRFFILVEHEDHDLDGASLGAATTFIPSHLEMALVQMGVDPGDATRVVMRTQLFQTTSTE